MHKWLIAVMAAILLTGCGMWDKTQDAYFEYVYPTPEVDLKMPGLAEKEEGRLARVFYPPDRQLTALLRHLKTQGSYPEKGSWFKSTLRRFSWLDGVLAVDRQGEVLSRYPEEGVKKMDFARYCPEEVGVGNWRIKTRVQKTAFGPEVVMARPFFKGSKWQGLLIVHFDPRIFAQLSPHAPEMSLVMDGKVLWSKKLKNQDDFLEQRPWQELLAGGVSGRFKAEGKELLWLSRRVGDNWLVYVIASGEDV